MDKNSKDKLTRMIQAQSDVERSHDSMRPLQVTTIYLSCGCTTEINSADEIAPTRHMILFCFHHMRAATVDNVEVRRWTP